MPPLARLNDPSDHGGRIITASPTTAADGIQVARLGDLHDCPLKGHGVTPIVTGSPTLAVDGSPAARVTDRAACGAAIVAGSPTVSVDD